MMLALYLLSRKCTMIVIVRKYYAPILSLTCLSQATVAEKSSNAIDICRDQNLCTDSLSTENSTAQQKHNLNLKSNQFGNLGINIFS